ncbi:MAG: hypothetical protein HQ596_01900 [Candidatus Saganbacteria bacterium]|nr:hypothetical protein [Candidatus Saganbacteria bacterium]
MINLKLIAFDMNTNLEEGALPKAKDLIAKLDEGETVSAADVRRAGIAISNQVLGRLDRQAIRSLLESMCPKIDFDELIETSFVKVRVVSLPQGRAGSFPLVLEIFNTVREDRTIDFDGDGHDSMGFPDSSPGTLHREKVTSAASLTVKIYKDRIEFSCSKIPGATFSRPEPEDSITSDLGQRKRIPQDEWTQEDQDYIGAPLNITSIDVSYKCASLALKTILQRISKSHPDLGQIIRELGWLND